MYVFLQKKLVFSLIYPELAYSPDNLKFALVAFIISRIQIKNSIHQKQDG